MRFAIRDVLWLTLLAAVLVAWWVDRRALSRRIDELEVEKGPVMFYTGDDLNAPFRRLPGPAGSRSQAP
jgi:hypothetical protein